MDRSVVAPKSYATQKRIIQNLLKAPLRRACQETLRVHLVSPIELYAGTSKEKDVTDSDEIEGQTQQEEEEEGGDPKTEEADE